MAAQTGAFESLTKEWLSQDLDEWTRHVMRRHFDPEHGSPYWLAKRSELSFDPLELTRYAELVEFGPFPLDDLRVCDPADLVPLDVPRPLAGRVWETGGTTGRPGRVFYSEGMLIHRGAWRLWGFDKIGFQPGGTWLQAVPSGPHLLTNVARDLSEHYGSLVHTIDLDPRWVKRLIRQGRLREANEYSAHLVDQIADVLGRSRIDYMSCTPALFQTLLRAKPELVAELQGVWLSGTQLTPEMHQEFTAGLASWGLLGASYGNTLGNSIGVTAEDGGAILPYVPNYPQVTTAVVDRTDWRREVEYGQVGQVRLNLLYEELLLPNVLERDQAVRYDTRGTWPSDGVANVRPLQISRETPEGVY
jgi:hypothetical protein